jgi:hypothetical protein
MSKVSSIIRIGALTLAIATALPAWYARPQTLSPDEVATLLEKAETRDDHLKLAEHYAAESVRLESEAAHHDALAKTYLRPNLPPRFQAQNRSMGRHCRDLAKSLRDAAHASGELASAHRAMAVDTAK